MPNTTCLWKIPVRKLERTCIYRAQFCTSFKIGKCLEKCKILQKSHFYKTTTLSSLCFLTYQTNFMLFLMRQTSGRQTMENICEMHEAKRAKSNDLVSTYFIKLVTLHELKNSFLTKAYFISHLNMKNTLDS